MASPTHITARPLRTRATWVSYLQIGLWVWVLYSFGPSLQSINGETPLAPTLLAIYGAGSALGSIIGGLTFVRITHALGRGGILRLGSIIVIISIGIYTSGLPVWITILGPLLAGVGGTFIVVGSNAFLTESQGTAAAAAVTESNAVGAVFAIVGPLTIGAGIAIAAWGWRFGPWLAAIAFVLIEAWRGRDLEPFDARTGHPDSEVGAEHPHGGRLPGLFWIVGLNLILLSAVEFSMTTWSATLLSDQAGFGTAAAAAAVGALSVGILIGRLIGARLSESVSTEILFPTSIVICLGGFLVMWLSSSGVVMLVGFVVCGLGMALHWPIGITRVIRASGGRPDRAGALVSIGVGITASSGPILLGLLTQSSGVHTAFVIVPVLLVTGAILSLTFRVTDPLVAARSAR